MATQVLDFTDGTGLTFDAGLIQIAGGAALLVGGTPSDLIFYSSFDAALAADFQVGDGAPTAVAGAAIDPVGAKFGAGSLDVTGNAPYLRYDGTAIAQYSGAATYSFWYKAAYNNVPAANSALFSHQDAFGGDLNKVMLRHQSAGVPGMLRWFEYNNIGNLIINATQGVWNPVAGTWYHFEIDTDPAGGATRLFIDGVQFGATHNDVFTVDGSQASLVVGGEEDGTSPTDAHIDDLQIYNTIQHTTNFIPPAGPLTGAFSMASPGIVVDALIPARNLINFTPTVTTPAGTSVTYAIRMRGYDYFFYNAGAHWTWRPTAPHCPFCSCTAAEMTAFIRALKPIAPYQLVMYLNSDGTATPSIDQLILEYN